MGSRFSSPFFSRLCASRLGTFVLRERVRYILAWSAVGVGVVVYVIAGWLGQRDPGRADGNRGHVSVDFSSQWLLGRLLARGDGQHLYEPHYQRATLIEAYPETDQDPAQETSDVEQMMASLVKPTAWASADDAGE